MKATLRCDPVDDADHRCPDRAGYKPMHLSRHGWEVDSGVFCGKRIGKHGSRRFSLDEARRRFGDDG